MTGTLGVKVRRGKLKFFKTLLFFFFFPALAKAQVLGWSHVYQKASAQIPIIVSGGAICSGALIEKDMIVTAAHCVSALHPIFVHFKNHLRISAEILVLSKASDLALIKLDSKVNVSPIPLALETEKNIEGTAITTIGHPVGQANFKIQSVLRSEYTHVMSSGLISRVANEGFVSDMSVSPGNSGGPVLNIKGEIVGVVSKKRVDRFVGQLNYISSHQSVHRLLNYLKEKGPSPKSVFQASTNIDLYLLYSTPRFRRNAKGDAKSYLNVGAAIDFWDRLRFSADTNVDSEEVFTEYGIGWNFYLQGSDSIQNYRIIPAVESLKFQWKLNGDEVEKRAMALSLTLKASWFPFFIKYSQFSINHKDYSSFALGLGF